MPSSLFIIQKVLAAILLLVACALSGSIVKAFKETKSVTPFQLNWLAIGVFAHIMYSFVTLTSSEHTFSIELKYFTFFSFLYYQLYITKYNLTLNKKLQKIYILLLHTAFDVISFYCLYEVVSEHLLLSKDIIFTALNNMKTITMYSISMVILLYNVYLLVVSRFEYKKSILSVLYSNLLVAFCMIVVSCAKTYLGVYYTYTFILICNIIENIALFKNVYFEKGRILLGR